MTDKKLYEIIDDSNKNELFRGVIYKNGFMYGTDTRLFVRTKCETPKDYKNKVVNRLGGISPVNPLSFSSFSSKLNDYIKNKRRDTIDLIKWRTVINSINDICDYLPKGKSIKLIRYHGLFYSISLLSSFINYADDLFIFQAGESRVDTTHCLISMDSDSVVMMAGCLNSDNKYAYFDMDSNEVIGDGIDLKTILKKIKKKISFINVDIDGKINKEKERELKKLKSIYEWIETLSGK